MSATAPSKPIQTPWGPSRLVERLELRQRAGDRRFASAVELLETRRGDRLVRFAYTTDGVSRRGPVTLRARDLELLRAQLGSAPQLAAILGCGRA
jgi:hypothetical protein